MQGLQRTDGPAHTHAAPQDEPDMNRTTLPRLTHTLPADSNEYIIRFVSLERLSVIVGIERERASSRVRRKHGYYVMTVESSGS